MRFRAPQKLDESARGSAQVMDARNFAAPCVQQPAADGVGSEDCLRLNIWKPVSASSSSKLPVAVYIHGGGFYAGTPQAFPLYDWIAQNSTGIVGVSIAYRMNILGFLSGSAVHADGDFNNGLLDQRAALDWVHRHIAKFGGDPDRVTIIGESAGAASVVHQIVAYGGAKGAPFQRAVAQSIGYDPMIDSLSPLAEELYKNFSIAAGCSSTQSGGDALACLREASIENVIAGINAVGTGDIAPVVDGTFIPALPSHLIANGRFSEVDFIGGHCANDGRTFVGGKPSDFVTDADIVKHVFPRWPFVTNSTLQKVFDFYPRANTSGSPFATEYDRAWTIAQDVLFGCMDQFLADALLMKGKKNVFTFRWNTPDPVLLASSPWEDAVGTDTLTGTNSAANAGFTFTAFNSSETLVSKEAIAYWTSFVSSGDPSTGKAPGSPSWQGFTGSNGSSRSRIAPTLGDDKVTGTTLERIPEFEVERCAFWMQEWVTAQTKV
ncbi:hypothetical protein EWM64_g5346 [Hericium alpestre]|uniref:Carboxylic ester hydrolase n=1 Tax=Hericium alpestre TaxID=135208 RepID=A0A4Y9ZVT9_9AGAM|nr:hypothetical protein EWM64_g5346 [Hericium alpestre]